ncbi:hypothetical protein [Clostridium sp. DJ247]|uniref:hypothetical protein n=1 Tax=Clostridium sp. DJ247 TaxID=2726188 RepID=UPI00162AD30F|nr:hypothetical protein [Clostridium sp. DJ247]MBC2582458.1 hypothetical protein [Clostridium sp. DJ247]
MISDKLLIVLIVVIAIIVIFNIIKKIAKVFTFILIIILAVSVFKVVELHKEPAAIVNSVKTDGVYTKDIYNYTGKVKTSVDNTINYLEKKSVQGLDEENKNLHRYLDEVSKLPHGPELNAFHDKYYNYLKNIVLSSDTALKGANLANGTVKNLNYVKDNLNKQLDTLVNMKP